MLDVVINYDDAFKTQYGSDAAAIAKINAVMAHVQTFYNLKDSLGTTVEIKIKKIEHVSISLMATSTLLA